MLFKINKLPVDAFNKGLIEKSLLWFENKLGADFINSREYLIPKHLNFKYNNFDNDAAIRYFIDYICNYIQLDPSLIEYKIMMNDQIIFSEGFVTEEDRRNSSSLICSLKENGKYEMAVYSESLKDFDLAFLKLCYGLIYIKLVSEEIFTFVNGFMINIAMVVFGFGIVVSNAAVRSKQWQGIAFYGWKLQRFGFINQRMYGYLLALLAEFKKEDWKEYLCVDVLNYFKQSEDFIRKNDNDIFRLSNHGKVEVKDEEVFINKFFYENGMISSIARYKDGKYHGMMLFYHQNGKLWSERIYSNGIPYTVVSNYNSYGSPVEKGTLKEGNGSLYIYNPNGSLLRIEEYQNQQKIKNVPD